jgi:hypothetical protein
MPRWSLRRLTPVLILVSGLISGTARAGGIVVTNNTNATGLVNTLLGGGTGGITVTNIAFSGQTDTSGDASTGIFTTSGPNNYRLTGTGIVMSTGNAGSDGSGPVIPGITTAYGVPATAAQTALLSQVASTTNGFFDTTELTLTFTAGASTSNIFLKGVFASAEFPESVGKFVDAFGLFLNGKNIAIAGGNPLNIDNPLMVDTTVQTQYQETALQGLLVQANGDPVVTFGGAVTPGSTSNTLIFIIADNNDANVDTAVFLQGLGNAVPAVPEPSSVVLLGLGVASVVGFAWRRRKLAVA